VAEVLGDRGGAVAVEEAVAVQVEPEAVIVTEAVAWAEVAPRADAEAVASA